MELIDLGFTGLKFTWRGTRNNSLVQKRLNRGLADGAWQARWPRTTVTHRTARASDHYPLIIDTDPGGMWSNHMFKFEAFWCQEERCKETIEKSWHLDVEGSWLNKLHRKIQVTKRNLKRWSAASFRGKKNKIDSLSDHLGRLQVNWGGKHGGY